MIICANITRVEIIKNFVYFWIDKKDKIIIPLENIASYGEVSDIILGHKCDSIHMRESSPIYVSSETSKLITLTNGISYRFKTPTSLDFGCFIDAFEKHHSLPFYN